MKSISAEEIARIASLVAIQEYERQRQESDKKKFDRRLHNTKLLLKNYRSFKRHYLEVRDELLEMEHAEEDNLNDSLDYLDSDEFALESIKRSKKRTLVMVRFIDRMLEVYEILCKKDTKVESRRYFNTIKKLYIDEPKMTFEQVAECHNVHIRTVRRDVDEAIKALTALIFGVDGIRFKS